MKNDTKSEQKILCWHILEWGWCLWLKVFTVTEWYRVHGRREQRA